MFQNYWIGLWANFVGACGIYGVAETAHNSPQLSGTTLIPLALVAVVIGSTVVATWKLQGERKDLLHRTEKFERYRKDYEILAWKLDRQDNELKAITSYLRTEAKAFIPNSPPEIDGEKTP